MAKTIKSIKCPQCGSNKVTELRPDYYQCQSCKTEFFLDNDDLTIFHKHTFPQLGEGKAKKYLLIGGIGFVLFLMLFATCFRSSPRPTPVTVQSRPRKPVEKEVRKPEWYNTQEVLFMDQKGKPHLIRIGDLRTFGDFANKEDPHFYMAAYDAKTGKQEWIEAFEKSPQGSRLDMTTKELEGGYLYIIINKNKLYRLTPLLQLEDADALFRKENEALAVGVAKYEFEHPKDFTALKIVTNEGKNLVYVPALNKAIPTKDFHKFKISTPPAPQPATGYAFSQTFTHFPDEKIRLVKYTYLNQPGYPKEPPRFGWDKDYGRAGIFTERSPYVKSFILAYNKQISRVQDYKILAEDRTFFDPRVLDFNETAVLVTSRSTPNAEDPLQVQLLDARTGALLQTLDTKNSQLRQKRVEKGVFLPDGGVLLSIQGQGLSFYDQNGKLVSETKQGDLKPVLPN